MPNGLNPDQEQSCFGPDLGPNCLQRLSADENCLKHRKLNSSLMGPWKGGGGPSIPYPFNYFEKYPKSLK